jgi:hypothetical protein
MTCGWQAGSGPSRSRGYRDECRCRSDQLIATGRAGGGRRDMGGARVQCSSAATSPDSMAFSLVRMTLLGCSPDTPGFRRREASDLRSIQRPVNVNSGPTLASGQAVRHLTLDQGIEGSNPSSPAKFFGSPRESRRTSMTSVPAPLGRLAWRGLGPTPAQPGAPWRRVTSHQPVPLYRWYRSRYPARRPPRARIPRSARSIGLR